MPRMMTQEEYEIELAKIRDLWRSIGADENSRPQVVGRVSGKLLDGDQVPGMAHAICHACGLGYRCMNEDCPNDKSDPIFAGSDKRGDRT